MRFQVIPVKDKWETFTIIDTKTKQDLFYKVKGWEKESIISWCEGLNKKYKSI